MSTLETVGHEAAEYIRKHGWTQEVMQDGESVCLHGAIKACTPQPGDEQIVRAVARTKGLSESWNDDWGRTEQEVLDALEALTVTDNDLADTFGPRWEEVVLIVRQASSLTREQIVQIAAARGAAGGSTWEATWDAARAARAARAAARDAAGDAAWEAARAARAARDAARAAAQAAVTRDLIGTAGYTQEHHDLLMAPWMTVFPTTCDGHGLVASTGDLCPGCAGTGFSPTGAGGTQ